MTGQIERIRIFVRVAETSSFARAARELNVSRSIVTRYVGELEAELGVQLLVRTTRKVSLTVAGSIYLDRMRPLLAEFDRATDLVKQQHNTLSGDLRISAPVSFGQRFLPHALTGFRKTYPDVRVRVDLTDRFVDIIAEKFDMALRISGPPADVSTIWRKIAEVPRMLVASPGYIKRHGAPRRPEDLRHHSVLGYRNFAGGSTWQMTHAATGEHVSQTLSYPFESNSGEVIVDMAIEDGGVTLMPAFMVSDHVKSGALVALLPDWQAPEIWLTAYYPPYEALPAKVSAFTSFVEERILGDPTLLCQTGRP